MQVLADGRIYYRTTEACRAAGISRSTLLRWISNGIIVDTLHRDRRGWRLFSEDEVKLIKAEANKIKLSTL